MLHVTLYGRLRRPSSSADIHRGVTICTCTCGWRDRKNAVASYSSHLLWLLLWRFLVCRPEVITGTLCMAGWIAFAYRLAGCTGTYNRCSKHFNRLPTTETINVFIRQTSKAKSGRATSKGNTGIDLRQETTHTRLGIAQEFHTYGSTLSRVE